MSEKTLDIEIRSSRTSGFVSFVRRLKKNPAGMVGLLIVFILLFTAIFANFLAPQDPYRINLVNKLKPLWFMEGGSTENFLGTDTLGRDILSRLIFGSRISLAVGFVSILLGATLGTTIGLLAGFFGKRVDTIFSWFMNVQLSFPFTLLALFVMAVFGGGLTTLIAVLAVGVWVQYARVMRGTVFSVKENTYVAAARAAGLSTPRILWRYILPNSFAPIIVIASFTLANTILAEAGLSFLGLGLTPRIPTWGQMLSDGRDYLQTNWWIALIPGLAISMTVLGINLFGDWLRDYLDPRLNQ